MKYSILFACLISSNVFAGGVQFQDQAQVKFVYKDFKTVQVPKQVCRMVSTPVEVNIPGSPTVTTYSTATGFDKFVGAAVGATAGHQFGKGKGKDAATILGGILGWSAVDQYGRRSVVQNYTTVTEYRDIETCSTEYTQKQVEDGYIVEYDYKGAIGTIKTYDIPGDYITVNIQVNP